MRVLVDGSAMPEEQAVVSVFDLGLQRGYGAFEVIRSYGTEPFRLGPHLERLAISCEILRIECPDRERLDEWVRSIAAANGTGLLRVMVTSGSRDALFSAEPRTIVIWEPLPETPAEFRVVPLAAPWSAGGDFSELTGAKTLSYAPNIRATMEAEALGYHDALLVSRNGHVLEGPTFAAAWVVDGVLETPSLDLGILASITRRSALETAARLGIETREGRFPLDRVLAADEVMGLSTVKEVLPVAAIGERTIPPGPVTEQLARGYRDLVVEEVGAAP